MASEIIVSINVKSGKAEVSLKKAKVSVDGLAKAQEKLAAAEHKSAKAIALVNLKTKEQIQANNQAAAATLKNVNKGSGQFRTQVGLNNAILTEAGRAASDLRFGFNGVANNVGQIASLFGSLINTSDNVGTSLKNLAKSLVGTGGVMIAIQLLIAYGDQVINFFRGISESAAKAEKAMKKLEGTIQSQRRELLGYIGVLEDSNITEEVRINALEELNIVSEETIQGYKDGKVSLEDLTASVETYIKQQRLRGELDAILSSNGVLFEEREKIRSVLSQMQVAKEAKNFKEIKRLYKENTSFLEAAGINVSAAFWGNISNIDFVAAFKTNSAKTIKEYNVAVKRILEIEKQLTSDKKDTGGGSGSTRIRVFKEKLLQLEKLEQRYREKSIDKDLQTNQEKIGQFQQNEFAKLDILEENFITRESLRLKNYIESVKTLKVSNKKKAELIADAEAKFTNEIKIAGEDRLKVEEQILLNSQLMRTKQIRKSADIARKEQEKAEILDRKTRRRSGETQILDLSTLEEAKSQTVLEKILGINRTEVRVLRDTLELKKGFADEEIARINRLLDNSEISQLRRSELESELSTQQGVQTGLRVQIIDLEAKARDELVDSVAKGLSAIGRLMKKGTQAQKSVSIASTLISTYASAAKAYESQLTATPDSPVRAVIAAAAAVAQGLARVASIRAVNPSGENKGASSSVNVSAPAFNVVGASATNQLAQTVAGQVNTPLRAYVVGSDVQNQLSLDRQIAVNGSIG